MQHMILPAIALAVAAALLGAGVVLAAGCFPAAERPQALRGSAGGLAVALLVLALLALFSAALWFAIERLSWPAAIIGAGLGSLGGPLIWQLAGRRADTLGGLLAGAVLAGAAAGVLALWAASAQATDRI